MLKKLQSGGVEQGAAPWGVRGHRTGDGLAVWRSEGMEWGELSAWGPEGMEQGALLSVGQRV